MIYYVECGNKFTLDYGDINESFYDALVEMYKKAIKSVRKMPKGKQDRFRERLEKIMKSADGIGWGYYDDLCHFYYEAFEQETEAQNISFHSDGKKPPRVKLVDNKSTGFTRKTSSNLKAIEKVNVTGIEKSDY